MGPEESPGSGAREGPCSVHTTSSYEGGQSASSCSFIISIVGGTAGGGLEKIAGILSLHLKSRKRGLTGEVVVLTMSLNKLINVQRIRPFYRS